MFVMLAKKKLIGHAGNIIANDDVPRFLLRKVFIGGGHRPVAAQVVNEKLFQALHGAVAVFGDGGMIVNVREEETLELAIASSRSAAETGKRLWRPANIIHGGDARCEDALLRRFDEIGSQRIQDAFQGFVEFEFFARSGVGGIDLRIGLAKKKYFLAQNSKIEQLGFEGIVNVRGVVSNFINAIDELGFKRRTQIKKIFGKVRKLSDRIIARMLDDAFANFKRKIQPGKIEIALLELFDDSQRVEIVIEAAALRAHQLVELALASIAERRMADVVYQGEDIVEHGSQC